MNPPIPVAIAGLGGYAAAIRAEILAMMGRPDSPLKLVAACEPDQPPHAAAIADLRTQGIQIFADFEPMLATPIEAVFLPLPIHLHRPMTVRALAAGRAVMCEKPRLARSTTST